MVACHADPMRFARQALIEGLDFAGVRADVLSLSLINYPDTAGLNTALQAARDAGAILIACAGNGGIGNADVTMPGKSPLTIRSARAR